MSMNMGTGMGMGNSVGWAWGMGAWEWACVPAQEPATTDKPTRLSPKLRVRVLGGLNLEQQGRVFGKEPLLGQAASG